MPVQQTGLVGKQSYGDGSQASVRQGRTGELIVQEYHAPLFQVTKEGGVFKAVTGVAGVAPGTALGATAGFALYNPANSGVNLVILSAKLAYISGTLGAGALYWALNNAAAQAAPTGTAITPLNANSSTASAAAKAFTTATLPASPVAFDLFCSLAPLLATTAVQPFVVEQDIKGGIIVLPGNILSLQAVATAGTAPLVAYSVTWEEAGAAL
jgi:hypothetical protein